MPDIEPCLEDIELIKLCREIMWGCIERVHVVNGKPVRFEKAISGRKLSDKDN